MTKAKHKCFAGFDKAELQEIGLKSDTHEKSHRYGFMEMLGLMEMRPRIY